MSQSLVSIVFNLHLYKMDIIHKNNMSFQVVSNNRVVIGLLFFMSVIKMLIFVFIEHDGIICLCYY